LAATKISELPVITAAETASTDLVTVVDVSATLNKKMTRDELIATVANNVTSTTASLAGADLATGDQFLVYDASASVMKDITRDELTIGVLNAATGVTSALSGAAVTSSDLFLVYDASAAAMKDITREELGITLSDVMLPAATAALNFGSIAAAASEDLTIAVTGAVVGDPVFLGLPAAPTAGIIFQCFVSASDVVTVRATNITGAPVDPASADYRVAVLAL
jgi:hypothetical protein